MIIALIAVLLVALVVLLVLLSWVIRGVDRFVKKRVVIHTRDDRSIRGVLRSAYRDCVVVTAAEYLDEAKPIEVPGDVIVLKVNVSSIQVLGG